MSAPTGVCVVGAGFWAQQMHLPAFAEIDHATVVALVGPDRERTEQVAEHFGVPKVYADVAEALADDDVEVLDVVAPNDVHAPAVIAAARAGRHSICIKPLGRDLGEATSMLEAVEASGTRLLYAENVPFIPAVQEAKRIVREGSLGRVFRVKAAKGSLARTPNGLSTGNAQVAGPWSTWLSTASSSAAPSWMPRWRTSLPKAGPSSGAKRPRQRTR